MFTVLTVLQVLTAAGLIAIVLVQRGPGATMGAAFGAGASGTVFGSRGAGNFLTRSTGFLALAFFAISLTMAVLASGGNRNAGDDLGVAGALVEQPADANDADDAVDSVIERLDGERAAEQSSAPDETSSDGSSEAQTSADGDAPEDNDELPEPPVE